MSAGVGSATAIVARGEGRTRGMRGVVAKWRNRAGREEPTARPCQEVMPGMRMLPPAVVFRRVKERAPGQMSTLSTLKRVSVPAAGLTGTSEAG